MVFAPRKSGTTHERFKARYEQHMQLIAEIHGDVAPLSHTRWYIQQGNEPVLLAEHSEMNYDVVVLISCEDEAGFGRFTAALDTDEANALVEADEAGFGDRRMKVMLIGVRGSKKEGKRIRKKDIFLDEMSM